MRPSACAIFKGILLSLHFTCIYEPCNCCVCCAIAMVSNIAYGLKTFMMPLLPHDVMAYRGFITQQAWQKTN